MNNLQSPLCLRDFVVKNLRVSASLLLKSCPPGFRVIIPHRAGGHHLYNPDEGKPRFIAITRIDRWMAVLVIVFLLILAGVMTLTPAKPEPKQPAPIVAKP